MSQRTFVEAAPIGAWAVERVKEYYRDNATDVVDVQGSSFFRSMDIDLLIGPSGVSGGWSYIEVKGDTHDSTNVFIETVSHGKEGCLMYTQADTVLYYFVSEGWALGIPMRRFRAWWDARVYSSNTDDFVSHQVGKDSSGYAVPVATLEAEVAGVWRIKGLPKRGKGE